ncbi:MAG: hypothetical protein F4X47_12430 [Gammaproteobacteria bacterium]|nr:hypothetical protein [Gammaproteobacteria bacterium]
MSDQDRRSEDRDAEIARLEKEPQERESNLTKHPMGISEEAFRALEADRREAVRKRERLEELDRMRREQVAPASTG